MSRLISNKKIIKISKTDIKHVIFKDFLYGINMFNITSKILEPSSGYTGIALNKKMDKLYRFINEASLMENRPFLLKM